MTTKDELANLRRHYMMRIEKEYKMRSDLLVILRDYADDIIKINEHFDNQK